MNNAILTLVVTITAACLFAQLPQPPWSKENGREEGEVTVGVLVDHDGTVKNDPLAVW